MIKENPCELIDFELSFTLSENNSNTWRQKIVSYALMYDSNNNILDEIALSNNCLAESMYNPINMLPESYSWQHIITKKFVHIIRLGTSKTLDEMNSYEKNNLGFTTTAIIKNIAYRELSINDYFEYMQNKKQAKIICESEYKIADGCKVKIYFPANYLNYNVKLKKYQIDVGPVLFIKNRNLASLKNITMGYCAFSSEKKETEFRILSNKLLKFDIEIQNNNKLYQRILKYIIEKLNISAVGYNKTINIIAINKLYVAID